MKTENNNIHEQAAIAEPKETISFNEFAWKHKVKQFNKMADRAKKYIKKIEYVHVETIGLTICIIHTNFNACNTYYGIVESDEMIPDTDRLAKTKALQKMYHDIAVCDANFWDSGISVSVENSEEKDDEDEEEDED